MTTSFDAAEKSPRYPELMAFTPDTSVAGYVVLLVFLTIFTGMCAVMTVFFLLGGPLALVPMFMALLGTWGFVHVFGRMLRFRSAPLERVVAIVRDETVETRVETVTEHDHHHGHHHRTG